MHKIRKLPLIIFVLILVIALITISLFVKVIPSGNVGIVVRLGAARDGYINPGPYLKMPIDTVYNMSTQVETYATDFAAFSSDMQNVGGKMTILYSLDKEMAVSMYRNVGRNYESKLIVPMCQESVKNVIGHYNAETLVSQRAAVSDAVAEDLGESLSSMGIVIHNVAIENLDFSDAFESAIEAKQVATQEKLRAQTQQEQETIVAKAQAERARIAAEAEADQQLIRAQAAADAVKVAADAEAYRLQQESAYITDKTIQKEMVQRWNGVIPVSIGGNSMPILDVSSIITPAQ